MWSDPPIIVAIATGVVGALLGLGSLLFSAFVFCKQRKQSQSQASWEEYRETVYDPLFSVFRHLEEFAKRCRGTRGFPTGKEEQRAFFRDLSETMNEVEISCAKADEHDASFRRDWTEQSETRTREIYDLVNDHNLDIEIIEHGDPHLLSLGDGLREYLRFFENRLREQRKEMLGF